MTKRTRGTEFPEPDERRESELEWDEVVDVICVGTEPGPSAQAISGARCGRRVIAVARPKIWDGNAAAYIAEMTADLPPPASGAQLPMIRARPLDTETDRRRVIDTFVGPHLRDWAAQCWTTPFGVLYTDVFGIDTTAMRTDEGVRIAAVMLGAYPADADRSGRTLSEWLTAQAREHHVQPDPEVSLQRLILEFGRVAGAELDTASGPLLVQALDGVALPPAASAPDWAARQDPADAELEVAIVGRPAGRFARVELLIPD